MLYFADNYQRTNNFAWKCQFFENCWENMLASAKAFTENWLRCNFALHFTSYLSIELSIISSNSKTKKNTKYLSVLVENDSRRLSNFLQTNIFWNFDNVSRTYYQINYRNIWLPKAIIILIIIAQVLFFNVFFEKTRTLMPLSNYSVRHYW